MDPIWYEGDSLPRELIDIAQCYADTMDSEDDSDSDADSLGDIEYRLDDDSQESEDDE